MTTIFSFLFLILVLIFIHELGHFLAAKSVGMRVEKFYLGFNLFGLGLKKKIGETEYGIGLFPLGGYVKVAGIIDESMDDNTTSAPYEYQSKNPFQQVWFASAGVIMNLLLAFVLFTFIILNIGIGEADPAPIIGEVIEDYPAEKLGMEAGDEIVSINGHSINSWEDLTIIIHGLPLQNIQVEWRHEGVVFSDTVTTASNTIMIEGELKELGLIGIRPKVITHDAALTEAIKEGFARTIYWFDMTFNSVKMLVTGGASLKEIGGPIMIAKMTGDAAKVGFLSLLHLMAIISVNLALLNILPIPGLDGGHIIFAIVEGVIRKKLPTKIKMGILQAGILFLMVFFFFILFNDISRLF